MSDWHCPFKIDPVPELLKEGSPEIHYFVRRDILGEDSGVVEQLWKKPSAQKILKQQRTEGSWQYRSSRESVHARQRDYDMLETFRQLGFLVKQYGFDRNHAAIEGAAEFLFSSQTPVGDLRNIYGTQYTPNYTAAILELLIMAGYAEDPRTYKIFDWLLGIRQQGLGWAIPLQTVDMKFDEAAMTAPTAEPDLNKPPSHLITGCVLRAFAAHPQYCRHEAALKAGRYLASRLFKRGEYPGRQTPDFWFKFCYPFWFTDLVSALDSLSHIGIPEDNPDIRRGLQWFVDNQAEDGLWGEQFLRGGGKQLTRYWVGLAVCRVFNKYMKNGMF